MNVINIRGTTGSGKTTIVRNLMRLEKFSQPLTISEGVVGHFSNKVAIIGPYKDGSNFGGVDAIKKISYVEPAILKALELRPTVIFEGLLISHSYERWVDFSKHIAMLQKDNNEKTHGMIWCFVTPPFRVNIQQLRERNKIPKNQTLRGVKGQKYIKNFISRYKSICRIRQKAAIEQAFGSLTVRVLNYHDPVKDLQFILNSDIITGNNKLKVKTTQEFLRGKYAG